jgi:hypothetical protein
MGAFCENPLKAISDNKSSNLFFIIYLFIDYYKYIDIVKDQINSE